jgi:hypothetical protein
MATADEIRTAMAQAAVDGVSSASFSAGSSSQSQMSIQDQIEAIRFLREEGAGSKNHGGIRFRTIKPPGSMNDT